MVVEGVILVTVIIAGLFTKWNDIYQEEKKDGYSGDDF